MKTIDVKVEPNQYTVFQLSIISKSASHRTDLFHARNAHKSVTENDRMTGVRFYLRMQEENTKNSGVLFACLSERKESGCPI